MLALQAIRPGKIDKALSPPAPQPRSELKTAQSRPLDGDFERLCWKRRKTIASYQGFLEKRRAPVGPESALPVPKNLIAAAIYQEYRILSEFKNADKLALELAATGGPDNILASVRLLKKAQGDSALRIQKTISWKMRCRLEQVRKECPAGQ